MSESPVMSESPTTSRRGVRTRIAAGIVALAAPALMIAAPGQAQAAPVAPVDAGVPFSSAVYGTGCLYTITVPVNASGTVTFWESRGRAAPRYLGKRNAYQGSASVWWTPNRIGKWTLYAVQGGKKSTPTVVRVHQGYGSGGTCFAI